MTADALATILVVDDDEATRTFLADNLNADGFEPHVAGSAADALRLLETVFPDLAIVDVGLPDHSGLSLLGHVRATDRLSGRLNPRVPVILLSGRAEEVDRIRGLERGADDFVAKPFSYPELRARVTAVLRRLECEPQVGRMAVGDLEIDARTRSVRLRGQPIELSAKEFALLRELAAQPTKVFTKAELLRSAWGWSAPGVRSRTVDSHACRLRRKLGVMGDVFVVNVWGVGYRLVELPVAASAEAA